MAGVDPRTELAMGAYADLVDVAHSLEAFLNRALTAGKLTVAQFRVMATLLHSGPQSQRQLIDRHFRTEGNGSSALAVLEERGLVARRGDARDKRRWVVHLTPEGHARIAAVFPRHANLVRAQMAALNGREQNALRRLCQKLSEGNPLRFITELTLVDEEESG